MPTYEYKCPDGHTMERLRKIEGREGPVTCHCGKLAELIIGAPHIPPSGVYSYEPNLGDADKFDRRHEEMKAQGTDG